MKWMGKFLGEERGVALIVVLAIMVMLALLGTAAVMTTRTEVDITGSQKRGVSAFYVAEAGIERAMSSYLWSGFFDENLSPMNDLFGWLDSQKDSVLYQDVSLGGGGEYTVKVVDVKDPGMVPPFIEARDVIIESTGRLAQTGEERKITFQVRYGIRPSWVFDYSYFMNHFGWWSGFGAGNVVINGNTRANSHYDLLAGNLTVNGCPRKNIFDGTVLDNGGVYAGGYVLPASGAGYDGMAQYDVNRHSYGGVDKSLADPALIPMPNLNDAGDADNDGNMQELNPYYEKLARGEFGDPAGKIGIDANNNGVLESDEVLFTGVYGDGVGETGNIVLAGDSLQPILIEGPVVVTNNVIIKGTISGKGTIYAGRNTYIAGDLIFEDPPSSPPVFDYGNETPEEYQARVDTWKEDNADKDIVGLATRENIVVADYTDDDFSYAMGWLEDYRNNGKEDVGMDGVFGKPDDPTNPYGASEKENDGQWTVQCRNTSTGEVEWRDLPISGGTATVPPGWSIVPGTGEDVDGDGHYDGEYEYNQLKLDVPLDDAHFANLPPGVTSFGDIAADRVSQIYACMYTNHALAGLYGDNALVMGAEIARNEAQVIFGSSITLIHDARLTGGGVDFGLHLPQVKGKRRIGWKEET